MNITGYFIKNPVSAIILNFLILLLGFLAFKDINLREYPQIIIPKFSVITTFPNASAEVVEATVTNILEDKVAGIEGVDFSTSSSSYGFSEIKIRFIENYNTDKALIAIKDAIGLARARLPRDVKEPTILKSGQRSGPPFIAVCLQSGNMNIADLTHYSNVNLQNIFRSISGVSSIETWGNAYLYRVTLNRNLLYHYGINPDEVEKAIQENNLSYPVGKFQNEVITSLDHELKSVDDIAKIIIKKEPVNIHLKDIAQIELVADDREFRMKVNNQKGICLGIEVNQDGNPLETSDLVYQKVAEIKKSLPQGTNIFITLDKADFIRSSLDNIKKSIFEAILCVLIVIFIFLGNFRATIIPVVTIPISLCGAVIFLKLFGFSINIMTLMAMVLAVGLVVDDAIIVLENITSHLEKGAKPFQAALDGAKEISFAVIAMTFTLTCVYAPIAFIKGITGQLFLEFAVALAGSVIISGICALTLSPLMCSLLLKDHSKNHQPNMIDKIFISLNRVYSSSLDFALKHTKFAYLIIFIALILGVIVNNKIPKETAPKEDRSLIGITIPLGVNQKIDDLEKNLEQVTLALKDKIPEELSRMQFINPGAAVFISSLKNIKDRSRNDAQIVDSLQAQVINFPSMDAYAWSWNRALPGLDTGNNTNDIQLVVRSTNAYSEILKSLNRLVEKADQEKFFDSIGHDLNLNNLSYQLVLDEQIMAKYGVTTGQIAKAVEIYFSGNDFNELKKDGILYPILIETDYKPWSLDEIYLRNNQNKLISLSSFAELVPTNQPSSLKHYNQMRSAVLNVKLRSNEKIDQVMSKFENFARQNLPESYQINWTGLAKSLQNTSQSYALLFIISIIFIYCILAVQYGSFLDPILVILTVPLACSASLITLYLLNDTLNIYSQIGLITLIGLITKHGILIVEFTNNLLEQGLGVREAVFEAAKARIRPILMTTGAMVFGTIPMLFSGTSGWESRYAIGIILVSGLTIGTIFTLYILPMIIFSVKTKFTKINQEI